MIPNSREKGFLSRQEGHNNNSNNNDGNSGTILNKASSSTTTTSRQWSGFRNPRIVRVSRTFGGKDRHSKVSTVRGLRDRRIRLSVPTAIQLYDLQDRLGLSQPSKVIDWLLNVTEDDIDKLPPLQVPHGFGHHQFHQQLMMNLPFHHHHHHHHHHQQSTTTNSLAATHFFDVKAQQQADDELVGRHKGKSIETNQDQDRDRGQNHHHRQDHYGSIIGPQKFFPLGNHHSSIPGLLNNATYNYFPNYADPSSLSLSQFGGSHGYPPGVVVPQMDQQSQMMSTNAMPFTTSMPASGSQLFFCPSTTTPPSLFGQYPSYVTNLRGVENASTSATDQPRSQLANHFQFLGSSNSHSFLSNAFMPSLHSISSSLRSLPGLGNSKQLNSHSQNGNGGQPEKDQS